MTADARAQLPVILAELRELLARPDNDFSWSSWSGVEEAVAELDAILTDDQIKMVFAPTGPAQEVSISSGWGSQFLELAERCDAALATMPRADFGCSLCEANAGSIELDSRSGPATVRRASFTSVLTQQFDMERATLIRAALDGHDSAAIYDVDPELAPWWCPTCVAPFCGDHWQRWDAFDDDGWHGCIRGNCPNGHERMLED